MSKNTSANTMRYQDVNLGEKEVMKMESAGTVTPECAYITRQEGVKRETIVIIIMEEKRIEARGVKTSNFPMTLMGTGETIQMLDLRKEIFVQREEILHKAHPI